MKKFDKKGVSLVELMIVALLVTLLLGGGYLVLATGQSTWFTTDVNIQLQENLRRTLEKITMEVRQSQVGQGQIFDGTGPNNTDIIRFSVPVICEAGGSLIDVNGDVDNWGAPFNWGCTDSTCMDADNDCLTLDYSAVEYAINNSNQLVRRVLNAVNNVIREDIFAQNIEDFQIVFNAGLITFDVTAQETTANNRVLTARVATSVFLRN